MQNRRTFLTADDDGTLPWRRLLQKYAGGSRQCVCDQLLRTYSVGAYNRNSRRNLCRRNRSASRRNEDFINVRISAVR